jgi:hypothetical protein
MTPKLKIVSDGTAHGTKVYTESGEQLTGITGIDIHPLRPGEPVRATLSFVLVELELTAEQVEPGYVPVSTDLAKQDVQWRKQSTDAVGGEGCRATVSTVQP